VELTIQQSLEVPKPSHWPTPMGRFGTVPFGGFKGEPVYRVVFAPTVRKLVFGQFPDGFIGGRVRQSYPSTGQKWILEKWISGYEDTRQTPAEYERHGCRDPQSGMLINGPYPYDGVYQECHTFESGNPTPGSIEKIIALIEMGRKRSFSEVQQNNREIDEKEATAAAEKRFLRCREVEPLYGIRPANFAGAPKKVNHKSQRAPLSANELGLPTSRNKVVARRGPKVHASL
jgi:hypothetical protein